MRGLTGFFSAESRQRAETNRSEFETYVIDFQKTIDTSIEHFFPGALQDFSRPAPLRFISSLREVEGKSNEWQFVKDFLGPSLFFQSLSAKKMNALKAMAVIRYVDDFIDTALWPSLEKYTNMPPLTIRERLEKFLDNVRTTVSSQSGIHFPQELTRLPLLELDFELSADFPLDHAQKFFDEHFEELIQLKSKDMAFVGSIAGASFAENRYLSMSLFDFLRDFQPADYRDAQDFNIYRHMRQVHIDPNVLRSYLIKQIQLYQNGPGAYNGAIVKSLNLAIKEIDMLSLTDGI